ncbi:hypothetical protein GOC53_00765 [Sinorhizobium medicae]|nr:hypothetical protein [Sinorhizobium medicae]
MSISILDFDPNRVSTSGSVFPDEIEADPWIMFHGSSQYNSESIERDGFGFNGNVVSRDEVERVVAVFEKMKWVGENTAGYPALKPFCAEYDFRLGERSLLFFAETSLRALLYATPDFAGGEKLRALRYALRDLNSYLHNAQLREKHQISMEASFRSLTFLNAHPSMLEEKRPVVVDLEWLRDELAGMQHIYEAARHALQRHDGGVVYALRVAPIDLEGLRRNGVMGIEADRPIPASKIISKVIVPSDYEINWNADNNDRYLARMSIGLLSALDGLDR